LAHKTAIFGIATPWKRGKHCPISKKVTKKKEENGMSDLRFFEKIKWQTSDFKKIRNTGQKRGLEIQRDCGPTPVARGGCGTKALPLAARPKGGLQRPWDLLQNYPLSRFNSEAAWQVRGLPLLGHTHWLRLAAAHGDAAASHPNRTIDLQTQL